MITHICSSLSTSILESNSLYRFVCLSVFVSFLKNTHFSFSDELVHRGLDQLLVHLIQSNRNDLVSGSGRCLCYLILHSSSHISLQIASQIFPDLIIYLLSFIYDLDLILVTLFAISHVLTLCQEGHQNGISFPFIINFQSVELYEMINRISSESESQYSYQILQIAANLVEMFDSFREIY